MPSEQFRQDLFLRYEHFEEGPLRDRKAMLPDLWNDSSAAEFLKDVLSMANSARVWGREAYLLFGIDDAGKLSDLAPSLLPYRQRAERQAQGKDWDERRLEECLWREVIRRRMLSELVSIYIDPVLASVCSLEYGMVGDSLCAYLLIPRQPSRKPFEVRKDFRSGKQTLLNRGEVWIRIGESKQEVKPQAISADTAPYCYAFTQVPYPLPSQWQGYFEEMSSGKFYEAYHQIPGYQDLHLTTGETLESAVSRFASNAEAGLLVIQGKAGSGKSVTLLRLIFTLAQAGLYEMEQNRRNERFSPPTSFIPVYFSLRGWEPGVGQCLDKQILDHINMTAGFWSEPPETPERMLDYTQYRWLICLDGLDEIWSIENRRSFLSALRTFSRQHPAVKVILTTRPDVSVPDMENSLVLELGLLTEEQIANYIRANMSADVNIQEIIELLQTEPDLWTLCGAPAFLASATTVFLDEFNPPDLERRAEPVDAELDYALPEPLSAEDVDVESATTLTEMRELVERSLTQVVPEVDTAVEKEHFANSQDSPAEESLPPQEELSGLSDTLTESQDDPLEGNLAPLRFGRVLDRIYRRIWDRESARRPVDVNDPPMWFDQTGELAARMDGNKNSTRANKVLEFLDSEEGLLWVLSLGVLERASSWGWIHFASETSQVYFAASFILPFIEEQDYDEPLAVLRQGTRPFWERTIAILRDISYTDVALLEEEARRLPT